MANLSKIFLATSKCFRTWKSNPRICLVLIILMIFQWYGFHEYTEVADYLGVPVSLCIFPFFVAPAIDAFLFGANAMILYNEAPFTDHHSPFIVIRTGKRNWIIGQILYIIVSSLIYTVVSVLLSFLVLLPNVELSFEWGDVMWTMAQNPELASEIGVFSATWPPVDLLQSMSGEKAMVLSVFLYWVDTVFLGMVILFCNVLFKKGTGMIVAGFLTCFSYFAAAFGAMAYGHIVKWFSPVCWRSFFYLRIYSDSNLPPIWYAFTVLIVSILVMSVVSVIVFCKKDLEFEKGEY